jgi:hypothetical protein
LPKLRNYNNHSHQIAFEMEETQVENFEYKLSVKTRNRKKIEFKTEGIME